MGVHPRKDSKLPSSELAGIALSVTSLEHALCCDEIPHVPRLFLEVLASRCEAFPWGAVALSRTEARPFTEVIRPWGELFP